MDFSYYEMDILVKRLNINNLHGFVKMFRQQTARKVTAS